MHKLVRLLATALALGVFITPATPAREPVTARADIGPASLVKDIAAIASPFGSFPDKLTPILWSFFSADDGATGRELWRTDGFEAGTQRVKDINPGAGSSNPESLTTLGQRLIFAATDGAGDRELWISDGTSAGTSNPNRCGCAPRDIRRNDTPPRINLADSFTIFRKRNTKTFRIILNNYCIGF